MLSFLRNLQKKKSDAIRCTAVVPAAGSATRMEGLDKVLLPLGDIPILARTLLALSQCDYITDIIVVTRQDLILPVGQLCKDFALDKVSKVVVGGATRTHSVLAGMAEVADDADVVAVHDGARPFVTLEVLNRVIEKAVQCAAAAPAVPVVDTIKVASKGLVTGTPDRSTLYAVQTPQVFEPSLLKGALVDAIKVNAPLTDDCSAVERLGMPVCLVEGDRENIKLTTPIDLQFGLGILNGRGELL